MLIFFVISGYLISNIIISDLNNGTFSFKNFYLRRVRRILPALFSIMLFTIPFAYLLLTPKAMQEYINSAIASIFFYANFYFYEFRFLCFRIYKSYAIASHLEFSHRRTVLFVISPVCIFYL